MEYVPTKIGFRTEKKVRPGFEDRVHFPLTGRAPQRLWNTKLEFGLEVVRLNPQTAVKRVREVSAPHESVSRPASIRRRAFDLNRVSGEARVLEGRDAVVTVFNGIPDPMLRVRQADLHTVYFVHRGSGIVRTDVGLLSFEESDYIHIPRKVTYAFEADEDIAVLGYYFPSRVMRPYHYWVDWFPFSQAAPVAAEPVAIDDPSDRDGEWDVVVSRLSAPPTVLTYPFSPFDAVAWEGDLYPFVLHLRDIRAIASPDFHVEPKVLTTFVTEDERASIQTFKPRWSHSLPYPHQNYVTEALFNHRGYAARPKIKDGCITVHPPGTFHGPDLRALARQNEQEEPHPSELPWRDEVAVMLEVQSDLTVALGMEAYEVEGYEESWYNQYEELRKRTRRT